VAATAFLVAIKVAGTIATGSLALGSAALDSLLDLFISGANAIVVRRSAAPPDADHAYGHGKFESLAELAQGLFLAAASLSLGWAGVERLLSHEVPRQSGLGAAVLGLSLVTSFWVARHLGRAAREIGSPALHADSRHYLADLWVNAAALAALLIVRWTGWWPADPLVALAVAVYVLYTAFGLLREALGDLTDRGLPAEELRRIEAIVAGFAPQVVGMHDLKTRRAGGERFVELHLEIPRATSFADAHDLTVRVLRAVERELPRSRVFVHGDPV
jgi:ferrous-iron efflux pump FieF